MKRKVIEVDITSDVVCPWCVIGYKQLEKALERFDEVITANIRWHPFELNPNMLQGGENLREHLAQKYGTTLEGSIRARKNITNIGAALGFNFDYADDMRIYNTSKAQQLLFWASDSGKQTELKLKLFEAYFTYRLPLDDTETLLALVKELHMKVEDARIALESAVYADVISAQERNTRRRGVTAVPTVVFDRKYMVQGAQGIDTYINIIENLTRA